MCGGVERKKERGGNYKESAGGVHVKKHVWLLGAAAAAHGVQCPGPSKGILHCSQPCKHNTADQPTIAAVKR
jgi:hypothetical protein